MSHAHDLNNFVTPSITLYHNVPGYGGYIPSVKAENLFARTYGDITRIVKHNINENEQYITKTTGDELFDKRTQKFAFVFDHKTRADNRKM